MQLPLLLRALLLVFQLFILTVALPMAVPGESQAETDPGLVGPCELYARHRLCLKRKAAFFF